MQAFSIITLGSCILRAWENVVADLITLFPMDFIWLKQLVIICIY